MDAIQQKLSITKIFTFETAHRISDYQGACSQLHGHSYVLHVTVSGELLDHDMLLDFKVLKEIVQGKIIKILDHALALKDTEEHRKKFDGLGQKVFWMSHEPTAERMLLWMKDSIIPSLPSHIDLQTLVLYETATSYATWNA